MPKKVFVTSTVTNGDLGGLSGADATCNSLASNAALGGTWVAWLSTDTVNAVSRLTPGSGPFLSADSLTFIANDIADLTSSSLDGPITEDENGVFRTGQLVWTATLGNGVYAGTDDCNDWTSSDSGNSAETGNSSSSSLSWTQVGSQNCDQSLRLYCFEL
jgi:hypothetical protein